MSSLKRAHRVYYSKGGFFRALMALLYNPSVRATFLMYHCGKSRGALYWILRNILITLHAIDVGRGARVGFVNLPHPMSIVIGKGSVIEGTVTLYQGVTLGAKGGGYPTLKSGVTIFPNATVVGNITLDEAAVIGANCFVDRSVAANAIFTGSAKTPVV